MTNKDILRRLVPGVLAEDYEVEHLNIYNLMLFLIAKEVNKMIGQDVINYGDTFHYSSLSCPTIPKGFTETDYSNPDDVWPNYETLENVEEVAVYIQELICNEIIRCGNIIDHITKELAISQKAPARFNLLLNQLSDSPSLAIIDKAAVDKELFEYQSDLNKVAPQLLEDEANVAMIKEMWLFAMGVLYQEFTEMVKIKLLSVNGVCNYYVDPSMSQTHQNMTVEDYALMRAKAYSDPKFMPAIACAGVTWTDENGNPLIQRGQPVGEMKPEPLVTPPQEENPNKPIDLVGWNDIKPGVYNTPDSGYSATEEMIIWTICQEKMLGTSLR